MNIEVIYGILIPFAGTTLGAAGVFFMKKELSDLVQRALTGFAAGVMVAASVWSLLIPAMEQSESLGRLAFLPAAVGFWIGILFLLLLDHIIPHLHRNSEKAEGPKSKLARTTMLVLAVTLHNIPEGMAVGVVYAGYLTGNTQDHSDGSTGTFHRYRDPELSGGSDYFHAASRGGYEEIQSIRGRNVIRHRGADQCGDHDPGGRSDRSGAALSARFCSGSDDLRGCGRTDPGDVRWRTFEHRNPVFRGWLLPDDDSGCGTWIKKYKRVVNEKIYHQWKPKAE